MQKISEKFLLINWFSKTMQFVDVHFFYVIAAILVVCFSIIYTTNMAALIFEFCVSLRSSLLMGSLGRGGEGEGEERREGWLSSGNAWKPLFLKLRRLPLHATHIAWMYLTWTWCLFWIQNPRCFKNETFMSQINT